MKKMKKGQTMVEYILIISLIAVALIAVIKVFAGKIGDKFEALGVAGYLTAWQVQWSNNDVAKVSGSLRDYQGL